MNTGTPLYVKVWAQEGSSKGNVTTEDLDLLSRTSNSISLSNTRVTSSYPNIWTSVVPTVYLTIPFVLWNFLLYFNILQQIKTSNIFWGILLSEIDPDEHDDTHVLPGNLHSFTGIPCSVNVSTSFLHWVVLPHLSHPSKIMKAPREAILAMKKLKICNRSISRGFKTND